ncbi:hypothetical protein MKX01_034356 [Papaver californicum]|nr:hypothetical protein MKX01_034356 [Papaver californicum]
MFAVEKLSSYITQGVYTVSSPFHPFGGAVDIIVVQQQDGSFKSSPWNVRFGKFQGVLKTKEKVVNISVNGVEANFHMYLDHKGEAYFLKDVKEDEENSVALSCKSSDYETDDPSQNGRLKQSRSCDLDSDLRGSVTQIDAGSQKIVLTTNSSRKPIFGFMFGRKSVKGDKQDEGSGAGMVRATSLECAEMAADLLEFNWSTNRSSSGNSSRLSASSLPAEVYNDFQIKDESSSEILDVSDGKMDDCSVPGIQKSDSYDEVSKPKGPSPASHDQDVKLSILEGNASHEGVAEASIGVGKFDVHNVEVEEREKVSMSEFATSNDQSSHLEKLGGGSGNTPDHIEQSFVETDGYSSCSVSHEEDLYTRCESSDSPRIVVDLRLEGRSGDMLGDLEQSFDEIDGYVSCRASHDDREAVCLNTESSESLSIATDVPCQGGSGNTVVHRDQSFDIADSYTSCCVSHEEREGLCVKAESSESPNINVNIPDEQCHENVNSCIGECEVSIVNVHPEVQCEKAETILLPESGIQLIKEIANCETESVSVAKDTDVTTLESPSSVAIHQEAENVMITVTKSFETDELEVPTSQSPVACFSNCSLSDMSNHDESSVREIHFSTVTKNQIVDSAEAAESIGTSISSSFNCSIHRHKEEDNVEGENDKLHPSLDVDSDQGLTIDGLHEIFSNSSMAPSDGLTENQFLSSDIDDFVTDGVQSKDGSITLPMVSVDDTVGMQSSGELNTDASLSMDEFAVKCSPEESKNTSSPMSIPRSQKVAAEESIRRIESAPILRSHIGDPEASDHSLPLSHSRGSSSENLESRLLGRDISSSLRFSPDSESHLLKNNLIAEDTLLLERLKSMPDNSGIEISLCRHLLFEGMGVDAASQAFEAEKMAFTSLLPSLLKDDRLVVRIGGQYFPWDAGAHIISQIYSPTHEQISEPKCMIAVDQVVKSLDDDASTTVGTSGGSWGIWPFTFKKSASTNSVQSVLDGTKDSQADNVAESINNIAGDKKTEEAKISKKRTKAKSIVPTSEQLNTLDLKEGQNAVTFTFSTAMLGKQRVEARIYLWKWNTRIVISDVDGTITKSDVLGQFMPLVGRDWSQTGVAHLFSAIKENGYQLLFLSARAISQAYITRQFLLNLKQDGKALPDGPVVISPDGLFPSLYREVIRRAPHEFKIACLSDIKALFPPDCNPFYAGFGNRDTDEFSYLKVGIPKGKIFIINPKGQVAVNRRVDTKSYTSLHELVNGMFPPMCSSAEPEEYNTWNFWKVPLPDVDI